MDANRLLGLSKLPVLGVITYENATSLRGASARKLAAWGSIPQSIANAIRDRVPQ
jgi:hypothetical protein